MNKLAHNLAKIAEDLYSYGMREEAKETLFMSFRLAHQDNPLVGVLGELGFKDEPVAGGKEIWIHAHPDGVIEYSYSDENGEDDHFDNLEDLVGFVADEEVPACSCGCGCDKEEEDFVKHSSSKKKKNVKLNKPFRTPGGPKKFSVYVKNEKGNVVKVNFGDPNMSIKRDDPKRRKNFRARHNCDTPGPKTKAKYWSCRMWSKPSVSSLLKGKKK